MPLMKKYLHKFYLELQFQADFNFVSCVCDLGNKWYNRFDTDSFYNAKYSGLGVLFESQDKATLFEVNWKYIKITFLNLGNIDFEVQLADQFPEFKKSIVFLEDVFKYFRTDAEKPFKHFSINYQILKEMQNTFSNVKKMISDRYLVQSAFNFGKDDILDSSIIIERPVDNNKYQSFHISALSKAEHRKILGCDLNILKTDSQVFFSFTEGVNRFNEDFEQSDRMFALDHKGIVSSIESSFRNLGDFYENFIVPIRAE